jgi:GLPGLI family protein
MKQLIVAIIALAAVMPAKAQKTFEGSVNFGIEYIDLPAEMAMMSAMLPDEMTTRIKGDKSRLEQSLGMGMSQVTITDSKKKSGTLLLDMMGKKMAVEMSEAELNEMKNKKGEVKPEIKYVEGDSKKIAGYNCKKAVIVVEGAGELVVYYTEDLPAGASKQYEGLKGFPLEYTIDGGQFKMKVTAKEVKQEKVDAALFVIPDGYEKMTFAEFQASMGGMMGG